MEPTKEEQNAINTLKRLAKRWPKSLWLFSANGTLCVMRKNTNGERAIEPFNTVYAQDYVLDAINIPNDGGDF